MASEPRIGVFVCHCGTNIAGSVKARGWDRSEVSLTGTMSEGIERLEFESDGRNVTIEVIYKDRGDREGGTIFVKQVIGVRGAKGDGLSAAPVCRNINGGHTVVINAYCQVDTAAISPVDFVVSVV